MSEKGPDKHPNKRPAPDVNTAKEKKVRVLEELKRGILGTLFWVSGAATFLEIDKRFNDSLILKTLEDKLKKLKIDNHEPEETTTTNAEDINLNDQEVFDKEDKSEIVRENSNTRIETNKKIIEELAGREEIKIKDEAMITALTNIRDTFGSAVIDKEILILKKSPTSMDFCTFNDEWVRTSKKELEIMYKYIDESMEKKPEAKKVLLGNLFETLISLKKEMQGGLLTRLKAHKIPVNELELDRKIEEFVSSPTKKETSCGTVFSLGFSLLGKEGQLQIQKLIVSFIKALATTILEDLNSQEEDTKKIARERYVTLINLIEKARSVKLNTRRR